MGESTKIEWCDHSWSPWWGCTKVSDGCTNCYADSFSKRVGHGKRLPSIWGPKAERRFFGDKHWAEPIRWNALAANAGVRRRVFCASMCDVFEDRRDLDSQRDRLWPLVNATPHLDWLLLTKRPENMSRFAPWVGDWPRHVWAGCTVEDQARADERLPHLMAIPAAVRFLSCEPLLGPVNLFGPDLADTGPFGAAWIKRGVHWDSDCGREYDWELTAGVDWVIVGGESGGRSRPFDVASGRSIVRQCRNAGVACFFKQFGAQPVDGERMSLGSDRLPLYLKDRKGGDPAEWPAGNWPREFPRVGA